MKSDLLKALALKAKNRLINKNNKNEKSLNSVKVISENDTVFYQKVKELINRDEYNLNPMKFLMDENKLMKLNPLEKEKYLFETIDKYHRIKDLIERENHIC